MLNRPIRIGYLSMDSVWSVLRQGSYAESQLKVATLFFDKIVLPVDQDYNRNIIALLARDAVTGLPVEDGVPEEIANDVWVSINDFDVEFDARAMMKLIASPDDQYFWKDIEAGKLAHGLQGPVLEALAETFGTSVRKMSAQRSSWDFIREMAIVATSMTEGFDMWYRLRRYVPAVLISTTQAEQTAAMKFLTGASAERAGDLFNSIEVYVPSARFLTWRQVFELRENKRIEAFRRWLDETRQNPNSQDLSTAVETLWAAFDDLKISTKGELMKGVASNIPLPIPINPASAYFAKQSYSKARKFEEQYDWLIMLHQMRNFTSR